jgi:RIO-like serine/threonine protein kinase
LTPADFAIVKDVFNRTIDLEPEEREKVIRELCVGDPEIENEVLRLIDHNTNQTILSSQNGFRRQPRSDAGLVTTVRRKTLNLVSVCLTSSFLRFWIPLILCQLVFLGVTLLARIYSYQSAEKLAREQLESTVLSSARSIEQSIEWQVNENLRLSEHGAIVDLIQDLSYGKIPYSDAQPRLADLLDPLFPIYKTHPETIVDDERSVFFCDTTGKIIAGSSPDEVGRSFQTAAKTWVVRAVDGEVVVVPPKPRGGFVESFGTSFEDARIWIFVPMRDSANQVFSVLATTYRVGEIFGTMLYASKSSPNIECYAFNERGMLLTDIGHTELLVKQGALRETRSAAFKYILREPGVDLRYSKTDISKHNTRPLTQGVRTTVANGNLSAERPYLDYRGVEVIGASKYLKGREIGVIAELETDRIVESLSPIRKLGWLQWGALGLTLLYAGIQHRRRSLALAKSHIGNYKILSKINEGGMGEIYLCYHPRLNLTCVAKKLRRVNDSYPSRIRIKREARYLAMLKSPHTVRVFDQGVCHDGLPFFIMNYIEGETLAVATDGKPMAVERSLRIGLQVIDSIAESHKHGIVHRDIKPQNVIISKRDNGEDLATMLDFGIVKKVGHSDDDLTTTKAWIGTMRYMPPERFRNPTLVDIRSDIYGLGILLYRMLYGMDPIQVAPDIDLTVAIQEQPINFPDDRAAQPIPVCVVDMLERALAKSLDDRYASTEDLEKAIRHCLNKIG